jgi:hypothetical protein
LRAKGCVHTLHAVQGKLDEVVHVWGTSVRQRGGGSKLPSIGEVAFGATKVEGQFRLHGGEQGSWGDVFQVHFLAQFQPHFILSGARRIVNSLPVLPVAVAQLWGRLPRNGAHEVHGVQQRGCGRGHDAGKVCEGNWSRTHRLFYVFPRQHSYSLING